MLSSKNTPTLRLAACSSPGGRFLPGDGPAEKKNTDVAAALESLCEALPFTTRYMVRHCQTGDEFHRDSKEQTPSASTRKVSIMMAVCRAVAEGRLSLDTPIVYEERLAEQVATGIFRHLTPGIVISLRDAVVGMIVLSDNICTKMVLERLTLAEVDDYCKSIGMTDTHHRFLIPPLDLSPEHSLEEVTTTTAADQVLLLQMILDAQRSDAAAEKLKCTRELCVFALDTLKRQMLRSGIASRLPFGTVVGSKSGRGKRGRMDVGVVFREESPLFIIAAFTDEVPLTMPDGTPGYTVSLETLGKLTRLCWDGF